MRRSSANINDRNAVSIPTQPASIAWDFDEGADVLYLSVGEPRPAVAIELGDGLVLRYDEARQELAGLTVIGLRARLARGLNEAE